MIRVMCHSHQHVWSKFAATNRLLLIDGDEGNKAQQLLPSHCLRFEWTFFQQNYWRVQFSNRFQCVVTY